MGAGGCEAPQGSACSHPSQGLLRAGWVLHWRWHHEELNLENAWHREVLHVGAQNYKQAATAASKHRILLVGGVQRLDWFHYMHSGLLYCCTQQKHSRAKGSLIHTNEHRTCTARPKLVAASRNPARQQPGRIREQEERPAPSPVTYLTTPNPTHPTNPFQSAALSSLPIHYRRLNKARQHSRLHHGRRHAGARRRRRARGSRHRRLRHGVVRLLRDQDLERRSAQRLRVGRRLQGSSSGREGG